MKNPIDVARHQRDKEINLLARQAVIKDIYRTIPGGGAGLHGSGNSSAARKDRFFMQIMDRNYTDVLAGGSRTKAGRAAVTLFDSSKDVSFHDNCVATRIARFIMDLVRNNSFPLDKNSRFSEDFYHRCMKELTGSDILDECDDEELLLIYLKQVVMMLREAKVLVKSGGFAAVSDEAYAARGLYAALFISFWNRVRWEDMFPSIPDAARDLRRSRGILIDMMLSEGGSIRIDDMTRRFFDMTGFGGRNDLYLISFIDFYFYAWLHNFGLIEYDDNDADASVRMRLTEQGRRFLRCLQSV